jgi:hypothetical protein
VKKLPNPKNGSQNDFEMEINGVDDDAAARTTRTSNFLKYFRQSTDNY